MINVKNPNQLDIFDPWAFLTPKRRQLLDSGWPGLFREHILPSIPVDKVGKYFNATFGRPTKKFYSMLGPLFSNRHSISPTKKLSSSMRSTFNGIILSTLAKRAMTLNISH